MNTPGFITFDVEELRVLSLDERSLVSVADSAAGLGTMARNVETFAINIDDIREVFGANTGTDGNVLAGSYQYRTNVPYTLLTVGGQNSRTIAIFVMLPVEEVNRRILEAKALDPEVLSTALQYALVALDKLQEREK